MPLGKDVNAIIIGSGFSGICAGVKLGLAGVRYKIFEKDTGLGGTWYANTYPGAACDIQSALYSLSFEPNPEFTKVYSPQEQILAYLNRVAQKYGITKNIELNSEIIAATWQQEEKKWIVSVRNTKTGETKQESANFLLSGVGALNRPMFPTFPEGDNFKGDKFHSAEWNHNIDLEGKTVAVIGSAASAVQFVPEIAPKVKDLFVFQRSPNWYVSQLFLQHFTMLDFSTWTRKIFALCPIILRLVRWHTYFL